MEKPVRINENEKIRTFNDRVKNGLEHALNFMLGTDEATKLTISHFEPFLMPIDAYIKAYKKQAVLIKLFSDHAFKGELYWFFELKAAITLGSLMRMLPFSSLEEKLAKNSFDATDQDAFGEVGNQLVGILDRAFRSITKKDIHLTMDFNKKVYPDETISLSSFLNHEEYVVLLCTLTIPKHGGSKLTLLLPRSLYEVMLNLEVSLEGITPKTVLVNSWDEELVEKIQTEMNSRYTKIVVVPKPDDILTMLETPGLAAIGMDLKQLSFPLAMQEAIFLKRLAANRTFVKIPYFLTWGNNPTEAGVKELEKLGIKGATTGSFKENFPRWAHSFTADPSKKY
jgi:hypothetical protein